MAQVVMAYENVRCVTEFKNSLTKHNSTIGNPK